MQHILNGIILLSCLVLCGCFYLKRTDISSDSTYKDLIGSRYVTKNTMKIYGASLAYRSDGNHYYYLITALPGIGGREIKDLGYLPVGTILKITNIIRLTPNITLDYDGIEFVAEIISPGEFFGLEIDIYSAFGTYTKSTEPGLYILSNEHFTQIEGTKQ